MKEINNTYWCLGDYARQRDFIKYNIKTIDCARVKKSGAARKITNQFYLEKQKICKKMIISTLNIGPEVIQNINEKEKLNLDLGLDRRGGDKVSCNRIGLNSYKINSNR